MDIEKNEYKVIKDIKENIKKDQPNMLIEIINGDKFSQDRINNEIGLIIKNLNYKVVTAKKLYRSHKDEQKILQNKTRFVTAKSRNNIIDLSIKNNEEIIIFDDGLQDRSLNYDLKFVCFNADNWIGNGQLIPSGPLREKIDSLKKFDALIINNDNM